MTTATEHQPRERAVLCRRCMRAETWAVDAICQHCRDAERRSECTVCHGDPQSVERYSSGRAVETVPADCPRCHRRNPLAHTGVLR